MPTITLAALDPLVVLLAALGAAWGVVSDRLAARWPEHEDAAVRGVDWRTPVVALLGAVALAAVPARFGLPWERLVFGAYFVALILLLATDLDQRLLPDLVTLPLVALAVCFVVAGADPLLAGRPAWWPVAGALVVPLLLFGLSIPFGSGAIGIGDLKLLISVGLLVGLGRAVAAVFLGALLSGVVIALLLATRRLTLKSYIPFGPFLIAGAIWAVLLPA